MCREGFMRKHPTTSVMTTVPDIGSRRSSFDHVFIIVLRVFLKQSKKRSTFLFLFLLFFFLNSL